MASLERLSSIFISVADRGEAQDLYAKLLGRAPSSSAVFRLGRTCLLLRERSGAEGLAALGFATPALPTWLAAPGRPELASDAARLDPGAFPVLRPSSRGVPLLISEDGAGPEDRSAVGPGSVEGVDHVVLFSKDIEASRVLYQDVLGLRLALDRSFEERGTRLLFFRVGGVTLEIGGKLGVPPEPDAPDLLWGIAYRVGSIDAARKRLAALDFDVSEVRPGRKPGTRVCTLRGPTAGVPTLLIEPAPSEG